MLVLSNRFDNTTVSSIQAGAPVGKVAGLIINPHKFRIEAFYIISPGTKDTLVLHADDIRAFDSAGIIIDHDEQVMPLDDLVRLQEIVQLDYSPMAKIVQTEDKQKLGKVCDFVVDTISFKIMKIHVKQSILKSIGVSNIVIDRSQIVELTDKKIVVQSTAVTTKEESKASVKNPLPKVAPQLNPDPSPSESYRN